MRIAEASKRLSQFDLEQHSAKMTALATEHAAVGADRPNLKTFHLLGGVAWGATFKIATADHWTVRHVFVSEIRTPCNQHIMMSFEFVIKLN